MNTVTRKAVLVLVIGFAATFLVLVSLAGSNSQAATPVGNSTTDWFPAINNTWPLCSETATISNVTVSDVTSTTAAVSWQTTPAARTCLDLDSDVQPVFTSPQPISQAFQGVAYAPGEYSNNLAWWGERVTDTIVSDVERIAAANFNAIVLYPAGPLHGAIHPWDQIVFTTTAAHGLKIAFRLEWVPSPFDWGPDDGDTVLNHYAAYLAYFKAHPNLLVFFLINMPLDDPNVPAATIGQQRAYVSRIYSKIKEVFPGATVYANIYYGWQDELHQAPVGDLVDGVSVVVYTQHANGAPFNCNVIPTATAPASTLICKDQFDYYLDKAWSENNLAALGKPLVLDSTGFAPAASYANPDQRNGKVADSWAKVRAIETLRRYLEQDERLYGWSYFKLLHKSEAGWGLIDRRCLDDPTITTTHHLTLTDLFPATRYTLTLRAGDSVSGPYTFTTAAAPTPTNVSPLLTITKPPYGHELVPPGGQLTIKWKDDDPDDNATIRLYYDANDAGCDGTLIVGNLAEHSTTGTYTWTLPSTLPIGSYYIYGQISDGTNPVECDYSSGRFVPSTETLRVLPLCGSITVDGVMDEPIWQHATPLTYAIHTSQADGTTATVRALWDQDYLYVGFEVQDSQVETASLDWDDDGISLIFNNGEFRCRQDVGGTGEGECERALHLPPCTTLDQPGDSDCGYTVEMRIRWSQARITAHARDVVPTDLLSVDHDGAPGAPYTATEFSKLSWDGDGSVDTTGRSLTLASRCGQCRCVWLPIVLIADNTASGDKAAMLVASPAVTPRVESNVSINSSTIANNSAPGFKGNISQDPRFVDPANGDYHLRPDSPCIDAGRNEFAPETDFEGDPRPLDGDLYGPVVTDMGMDEFHMGMDPFQTVLAAYQAWHGLPSHAPAPYTSTDPLVISNHITKALAQGIDGFVVDWYGPPDGWLNDPDRGFIDLATAELLRQAEGRGFYVAIMYDEGTLSASGVPTTAYQTRAISDLLYARQYLTMPAYLLINRRPAVFVFAYDNVDPYLDWAEVRDQLGIAVTLLDRDPNPGAPVHDAQFDGFYAWVQPTGSQWSPLCTEWGEGYLTWFYDTMATTTYTDRVTIGGAWPGFDDSLASWGSGRCMSRRCGQTWRDTWDIADRYHPPIVMIETWNDFEEDTDVEYGTGGDCLCYLPLLMRMPAAQRVVVR